MPKPIPVRRFLRFMPDFQFVYIYIVTRHMFRTREWPECSAEKAKEHKKSARVESHPGAWSIQLSSRLGLAHLRVAGAGRRRSQRLLHATDACTSPQGISGPAEFFPFHVFVSRIMAVHASVDDSAVAKGLVRGGNLVVDGKEHGRIHEFVSTAVFLTGV